MNNQTLNEILAYKNISKIKDYKLNSIDTKEKFNKLIKISRKNNGELFDYLKIFMVLSVKWHFDYLTKAYDNPKKISYILDYWIKTFLVFSKLSDHNWIINHKKKELTKKDVWKVTKNSFNFMWPKNTKKNNYNISSYLIKLRIKQIIKFLPKNFIKNKIVLDSGCGPGRYINEILRYKPKLAIGIDSGKNIILENKKKFRKFNNVRFDQALIDKLKFKENYFDFLISAGVLHHTKTSMNYLIKEHAKVIKKGGYFFVFIAGKGGVELDVWNFSRKVMINVDINKAYSFLKNKISHMRLQGFLDHSYGEYKSTPKDKFENILNKNFSKVIEIPGVNGADVTKHTFKKDKFFKVRFGSGNLRYLCKK